MPAVLLVILYNCTLTLMPIVSKSEHSYGMHARTFEPDTCWGNSSFFVSISLKYTSSLFIYFALNCIKGSVSSYIIPSSVSVEYSIRSSARQPKTLARANTLWTDALLISLVFNSYCCSVLKFTPDFSASSF